LKTINLSVKVVVNDMGSSNICVSNILNVTPERPFFTVDGEDVVYMFDVPHLLKATRNMLMKHIFYFDGKSTSWSHVVNFYNKDKSALNRLAPKLTDAHVHPSNPEKMKVFLAAHVLSARVAAAMTTYVALGELPQKPQQQLNVLNGLINFLTFLILLEPKMQKNSTGHSRD
jgi:hypothetical protein